MKWEERREVCIFENWANLDAASQTQQPACSISSPHLNRHVQGYTFCICLHGKTLHFPLPEEKQALSLISLGGWSGGLDECRQPWPLYMPPPSSQTSSQKHAACMCAQAFPPGQTRQWNVPMGIFPVFQLFLSGWAVVEW